MIARYGDDRLLVAKSADTPSSAATGIHRVIAAKLLLIRFRFLAKA